MKQKNFKTNQYDLISISHLFYPTKGGLENMAYSLLTYFAKNEIKSIAIHGGAEKTRIYSENGFKVKAFKTRNLFDGTYPLFGYNFCKYVFHILKANPKAKVLIHSRHLISSFFSSFICLLLRREYYLVEHTAQTSFLTTKIAQILVKLYELTFSRFVVKRARHIISVSNASKEYLLSAYKIKPEKITVIYNGIDVGDLEKFRGREKQNVVVFASKFIKVKDPQTTYEAFKILCKKYPNWAFYFIGKGDLLKPKEDEFENLRVINDMISREKIFRLLAQSKIYINSSLSEALSLTIIEATLLGNVPVLSNAPSNLEIATKLGTKDLVFERENQQNLIQTIEIAMNVAKDADLSTRISNLTEQNFNNESLFKQYVDTLF